VFAGIGEISYNQCMGSIFALFSALFWGCADFLAAFASRKVGDKVAVLWASVSGCIFSVIYFLFIFSSLDYTKIPGHLSVLILISMLQATAYLSLYKALCEGKAGIVMPIIGSWSIITVILSLIFLHERLSLLQFIAFILIVSGVILLSFDIKEILHGKKIVVMKGIMAAFISMISFGLSFFLTTSVTKDLGWFLPVLLYRLIALVILVFYLRMFKKKEKLLPERKYMKILIPIGIFDIGAFFAFSIGLFSSQASIVAPISSTSPLFTMILAYFFLKEKLTKIQIFGAVFALSGIVLSSL
jgi:drug/metabolite transporter (DMT)-like permease